jgi:hypothetical protein
MLQRPLLRAIELACDMQTEAASIHADPTANEKKTAESGTANEIGKDEFATPTAYTPSTHVGKSSEPLAKNMSYILTQSPHLPLGWTADDGGELETGISEVEGARRDSSVAALNEK